MSDYTDELIRNALKEDLGDRGDITSLSTIAEDNIGRARIIAKAEGIIAGGDVAKRVFEVVDQRLKIDFHVRDGEKVRIKQPVISIHGPLRGILTGERTALNFLCRLSGIATLTDQFVEIVKGTHTKILDTRKTIPGLRMLEKYAVRMGGGFNHRSGLYDMVLIKENHIAAAGSIKNAVRKCHDYLHDKALSIKIEVETQNLDEVKQALELNVDRIMLDNMSPSQVSDVVAYVDSRCELEISGGINLNNVAAYAQAGVDYISIGGLTHSAAALDFSLLVE